MGIIIGGFESGRKFLDHRETLAIKEPARILGWNGLEAWGFAWVVFIK